MITSSSTPIHPLPSRRNEDRELTVNPIDHALYQRSDQRGSSVQRLPICRREPDEVARKFDAVAEVGLQELSVYVFHVDCSMLRIRREGCDGSAGVREEEGAGQTLSDFARLRLVLRFRPRKRTVRPGMLREKA